jgi:hypothetical protein
MMKLHGTKHGLSRAKVWPAIHVLVHFQKLFCQRVQKSRCSGIECPKVVQGGSMVGRLTSGPHVPNLQLGHRLNPPMNTPVPPW